MLDTMLLIVFICSIAPQKDGNYACTTDIAGEYSSVEECSENALALREAFESYTENRVWLACRTRLSTDQ
jgi:hypothetical protein